MLAERFCLARRLAVPQAGDVDSADVFGETHLEERLRMRELHVGLKRLLVGEVLEQQEGGVGGEGLIEGELDAAGFLTGGCLQDLQGGAQGSRLPRLGGDVRQFADRM